MRNLAKHRAVKKNLLHVILIITAFCASSMAQTVHIGVNGAYGINYLLNNKIDFEGEDTVYVFSTGSSVGLSGAFYFDFGGYYYRKLYGVKTELNLSTVRQAYKVFPGNGPANPNLFYQYKARLSYLDVPLLFNFCPSHHQGFTLDVGPQVSFLRNAQMVPEESRVSNPLYPNIDKDDFRKAIFSAVLGIGCFYNFTETFALVGTFRMGYSFSDLMTNADRIQNYSPTRRTWAHGTLSAVYKFNKYYSDRNRGAKYYVKRLKKR